ncbi:hypothetical protein [Streptomyces sp. JHA26]|uniref:hypothetical protein n=1 Tax=Streptomyces sp. JHA26 TaxID=1917143 RepID=UPI00117E1C77|nr:hypothetical protein [Streptomyces sp. JHA26]
MGSSNNEMAQGCAVFSVIGVVALILAMATQCGGDGASDAASTTKPSATADSSALVSPSPVKSAPQEPEKTSSPEPQKVTLSLAEIAGTPGTFDQFEEFVAQHGTAEQKKAVQPLKGWRAYERKWFRPALEVDSDYPTIDYEAIDGGDMEEMEKLMGLEKQSQYIAEAFAAWWEIDETATLQVYDRGGEYMAGSSCISPNAVENEGSCD